MPETKPLTRTFLLSLPLLMAAIWLALWALVRMERSQLIARLNATVTYGSIDEASLAMRQLARLPDPPADPFVVAAASPTYAVAREAQLAIADILRNWQRQLRVGRDADEVVTQVLRLAKSLDQHRDSFSQRDFPWLVKTTQRMVRLANSASTPEENGLACHCESLFAYLSSPIIEPPIATLTPVVATISTASATTDFRLGANHSSVFGGETAISDIRPAISSDAAPGNVFTLPPQSAYQAIVAASDPSAADPTDSDNVVADPPQTDWNPNWTRPVFEPTPVARRTAPSVESRLIVRGAASPIPVVDTMDTTSAISKPLAAIDTRTLFERWHSGDAETRRSLQLELARRGFGVPDDELLRLLLSLSAADRIQLVDRVLATPGANAKAWLMMLADDADADVRLAAVTVMATSRDPELIEKAWQTAIHDRDPRVARLSERLRTRRSNEQRR